MNLHITHIITYMQYILKEKFIHLCYGKPKTKSISEGEHLKDYEMYKKKFNAIYLTFK